MDSKQKKNIIALADRVERNLNFNMGSCERCIAGNMSEPIAVLSDRECRWVAEAKYGLTGSLLSWLVMPNRWDQNPGNTNGYDWQAQVSDGDRYITTEHAAETLRYLAETGEVSWDMGAARLRQKQ